MSKPHVTIKHPVTGKTVHEGAIISAVDYGNENQTDWYIEFECTKCKKRHYLKQVIDGWKDYIIKVWR